MALGTQCRQGDGHDFVIIAQDIEERRVEFTILIGLRGALEFIVEFESVEKRTQAGIIVMAEAFMGAERVRDAGQRLSEMRRHRVAVRDIAWHAA